MIMNISEGEIHFKISIKYNKTKSKTCNKGNLVLHFQTPKMNVSINKNNDN